TINISGTTGDEKFVFGESVSGADDISGGSGTDTLQVSDTAHLDNYSVLNGIEVLDVRGGGTINLSSTNAQSFVGSATDKTVEITDDDGGDLDIALNASGYDNGLSVGKIVVGDVGTVTLADVNNVITLKDDITGHSIVGGSGDDTIIGSNQDDIMEAGDGQDKLIGEEGADTFIFTSNSLTSSDVVQGGAGTDTLRFSSDTSTSLVTEDFNGVSGVEKIEFGDGGYTVNIDASSITDSPTLIGGNGDDVFQYVSSDFTDDDNLEGGSGSDTLEITDDDTNLSGLDWNNIDSIEKIEFSEEGTHQIDQSLITEFDTIAGSSGTDTLAGSANSDSFDFGTTTLKEIDEISMGGGDDSVDLSSAAFDSGLDVVGGDGNDELVIDFTNLDDLGNFDAGADNGGSGDKVTLSGYNNETIANTNDKFKNLETLDLADNGTITIDAEAINNWRTSGAEFTITSSDADNDTLTISNDANYSYKENGATDWTTDGSDILTNVTVNGSGSTSYLIDTDNNGTEDFTLHVV
ncbi:MAG: hypothetical protein ACLFQJ_08795, partial [Campylobacterales bacterium]